MHWCFDCIHVQINAIRIILYNAPPIGHMDWIGLDLENLTHVQLCVDIVSRGRTREGMWRSWRVLSDNKRVTDELSIDDKTSLTHCRLYVEACVWIQTHPPLASLNISLFRFCN